AVRTRNDIRRLGKLYTEKHDQLDAEVHVREALGWLCRAQDEGTDRGVAYGTILGRGFEPSYPETTGYIIPTILTLADRNGDASLVDRAKDMGDWEISIQLESGAVMAGKATAEPAPAIFNTGQVLLGWNALLEKTGEERYETAARRASDWMVEMQDPDGFWFRGNSPFANPKTTVYNVRAAWGLAQTGKTLGEERYVAAAVRNAAYAVGNQRNNGWFANCCLTDAEHPLTHTLAYTARGLLEIGRLCGRDDFVEASRRTAGAVVDATDENGFLAARFGADWSPAAHFCCLTGAAQFSIILSKLGDAAFKPTAAALNRYLMARHDISNEDPAVRGGLAGSWPVWGDYGRFTILNWATKFFVDALLEA
ncbi:MAG: hypothetical protein OER88_05360, partial [Planctomycetota bacterium]|nr:hypothetical protein [Planctomycetota bacterium]